LLPIYKRCSCLVLSFAIVDLILKNVIFDIH
jgi:hypothetical protein